MLKKFPYTSIVSLVPSLTELLFSFGLGHFIKGRTKFCIHPVIEVMDVPVIGGTKNPNIDKIKKLKPDIVIANKEENRKEDIEELEKFTKVVVTEIKTVEEAISWIEELGKILNTEDKAEHILQNIKWKLEEKQENYPPKKTAYLIWREPWMSIGNDTYIHDVMAKYGLVNIFSGEERYPEFDLDELADKEPELILLSSEPFPFKQEHIQEIKRFCPDTEIQLVDGEWFSWYGSRMVEAFSKLNDWRQRW